MKKIFTLSLHFTSLFFASSQLAGEKLNILFIAIDDLKPTIGAYTKAVPTPAMDRIAARGTTFLNAHCQQAVCGPSRASAMTGKYPDFTQIWDLKTKIRAIHPEIITLTQHFKNNGYLTTGVGKIFDPRSVDKGADSRSWSEAYTQIWHLKYNKKTGKPIGHYHNSKSKTLAAEDKNANWSAINKKLFANDAWPVIEALDVPDDAYDDGAIAAHAVKSLAKLAKKKKPFFLAVGFKKPHLPFVAPKRYWDRFDPKSIQLAPYQEAPLGAPKYAQHNSSELRSYNGIPASGPLDLSTQRTLIHGYYACVAYIDTQIGKILDQLEQDDLAENTIIVLWGDHGWHLGDHGLWCKHTNYEQATRVPLIIAHPGAKTQKTEMPAELTDLFPTLCDLAGIQIPDTLDGISLAPTVHNQNICPREFALSQFPAGKKMGYALRNDRYRFVAWFVTGGGGAQADDLIAATELYDYATDPLEQKNLVNDPKYKTVVAELSSKLLNSIHSF